MITVCPLCTTSLPTAFLRRARTPAMQNALLSTQAQARDVACGALEFSCCECCGFVTNAAFDPTLTAYDKHYENSQHHSLAFSSYLDHLVHRMAKQAQRPMHVVEVGCGKGEFLKRLVAHMGPSVSGTGFDPAYEGPLRSRDGLIEFIRRFYDASAAAIHADIVVCRHVIEHVADPMTMLRAVRAAVATNSQARIFFETPCVDWILERGVLWDFFYEHCSLFTADSLGFAFANAGFVVQAVDHIFGGQYLLIEATPTEPRTARPGPGRSPRLAQRFTANANAQMAAWDNVIRTQSARGPIAVWGAGAKGVTILNLLDADARRIAAVVDINPRKQQRHIPGTGHRCISPAELSTLGVHAVLATNPNYLAEIQAALSVAAPGCHVINLMEPLA